MVATRRCPHGRHAAEGVDNPLLPDGLSMLQVTSKPTGWLGPVVAVVLLQFIGSFTLVFMPNVAPLMAAEFGWDEDWLNDGVKGWLSASDANPEAKSLFKTYPSEEHQGLRVFVAKPEYLFAMKCRAMRVGGIETSPDIEDIRLLAREIGITSVEDALVEKFYPNNILAPKTKFGLEEIFSALDTKAAPDNVATSPKK